MQIRPDEFAEQRQIPRDDRARELLAPIMLRKCVQQFEMTRVVGDAAMIGIETVELAQPEFAQKREQAIAHLEYRRGVRQVEHEPATFTEPRFEVRRDHSPPPLATAARCFHPVCPAHQDTS